MTTVEIALYLNFKAAEVCMFDYQSKIGSNINHRRNKLKSRAQEAWEN